MLSENTAPVNEPEIVEPAENDTPTEPISTAIEAETETQTHIPEQKPENTLPVPVIPKKKTRHIKSFNLNDAEATYIDGIIAARKASGLTRDYVHFVRQCLDFALHHRHHPGSSFAIPTAEPQYLNDAFFKPKK